MSEATVNFFCPTVGRVSVDRGEIELKLDHGWGVHDGSTCEFACPGCGNTIFQQADSYVVGELQAFGVEAQYVVYRTGGLPDLNTDHQILTNVTEQIAVSN